LKEDGVFVQWLALNQFDIQTLNAVLRSFQQIFPDAQLFMDGMHLALVGPRQKLSASIMLTNLQRLTVQEQVQVTGGEGAWTWLGRYWGPISASSGPVQDEWVPYIEFRLPRARYDGSVNLANLMMWLLQRHPDPNAAMKILGIGEEDKNRFGRAYVATELAVRAWAASIQGDAEKAGGLIWLAYRANPDDHWIANALADNMQQSLSQANQHGLSEREALQRILEVNPDFVAALRAIWHLERSAGNVQEAERYRLRLLAASPLDGEARFAH
jgi:spermidine synthase